MTEPGLVASHCASAAPSLGVGGLSDSYGACAVGFDWPGLRGSPLRGRSRRGRLCACAAGLLKADPAEQFLSPPPRSSRPPSRALATPLRAPRGAFWAAAVPEAGESERAGGEGVREPLSLAVMLARLALLRPGLAAGRCSYGRRLPRAEAAMKGLPQSPAVGVAR